MEAVIGEVVSSVTESVMNCLLKGAKRAIDEDVALKQGIQRDLTFLTEEQEAMQSFLGAADEERNKNKIPRTRVKQIHSLACDVEDCLQEYTVHLENPSWWRLPRTQLERHRIAEEMKGLRARVEDMAKRNSRYILFEDPSSKPERSSIATNAEIFGVDQARLDKMERKQHRAKHDLVRLISRGDEGLTVIALWVSGGDHEHTSIIINGAYDCLKTERKFKCHANIRVMRPFSLREFLQTIVRQQYVNSLQENRRTKEDVTLRTQVLSSMATMKEDDLADVFKGYLNQKSYLILLDDLNIIEEWDRIKTCFPNNKKGSRIIVSTEQVEVASLCIGPENVAPEHSWLSLDPPLHAFYDKGSQDVINSMEAASGSNTDNSTRRKNPTGRKAMVAAFTEFELINRKQEQNNIINLIINEDSEQREVISVWGMGGLGDTTLVKDIFQRQELSDLFEKRAWVTITSPFDCDELVRSLAMQLKSKRGTMDGKTKLRGQNMLADILEEKKYLIVLDDLSSTTEWDAIIQLLPSTPESRILVTTRVRNIAEHCSIKPDNIYNLQSLGGIDAHKLFTEKVFGKIMDLDEQYPELVEQANMILQKCNGLPLVIVTIGGFLANQVRTALEWRKLNEQISAELEMNPELGPIKPIINKSYDGLPYHLKACLMYLPIFPKEVSRRRLVRQWIAEGYISALHSKSVEEIAEDYFFELISRSMLLPSQQSIHSRKGIDACYGHNLIREICTSKSLEENFVFKLEDGCSLNRQATVRHLAISSNWKGGRSEFESIVDLSRVRSITVFGKWRSFFLSDKMKLLRVLDLEGTSGLADHHILHIGKLLLLKYLSLRGCDDIYHLPDSLGYLRQLQTLDVRNTGILKLPKSIIKLRMLKFLRVGRKPDDEKVSYEEFVGGPSNSMINSRVCRLTLGSVMLCAACCACAPSRFSYFKDMNRHDMCTTACCALLPAVAMRLDMCGVLVPRGMKKLIALHTLGVVNVARGKVIQDIEKLTQLRKLGVTGINTTNCQQLCSAIAGLNHLESLALRSEGKHGLLECLDGMSSPPENLQSLKLYGNLVKLPGWIQGLQNLVKLSLRSTRLSGNDEAMEILGYIPYLAILRLLENSFQGELLNFHIDTFRSLTVLVFENFGNIKSVKFDQGTMPKLEQLEVRNDWEVSTENGCSANEVEFSGLDFLPSIKEAWLKVSVILNFHPLDEQFKELRDEGFLKANTFEKHMRDQLAGNPRKPIIKVGELESQD